MFYTIISNGAIVLCFIPFLFLSWKNMRKVRTWWVLGVYWLLNGLDNFLEIWFSARSEGSHVFVRELSFCYSLVETPLVLLTFALARRGCGRKGLLLVLVLFTIGESRLLRLRGNSGLGLIFGSGLGIILLYSLMGLLDYVKNMNTPGSRTRWCMYMPPSFFLMGCSSFMFSPITIMPPARITMTWTVSCFIM